MLGFNSFITDFKELSLEAVRCKGTPAKLVRQQARIQQSSERLDLQNEGH